MISRNLFHHTLINQVRFWFHHHSRADVEKSVHEFFVMLEKFRTEKIELTTSPLNQKPVFNFLLNAAKFHILKNRSTFDALFNSPLPLDHFAEDYFAANLIAIRVLKEALDWFQDNSSKDDKLLQLVLELRLGHCLVKSRSENYITHWVEGAEIFTKIGQKILAEGDQNLSELLGNAFDGLGIIFLSLARESNALRSSLARRCFEAASTFYHQDLVDQCRLKIIFSKMMEAYSVNAFEFYSGGANNFSTQNQNRREARKLLKKLGHEFLKYKDRESAMKSWDLALRATSPPDEAANRLIRRALQLADSIPDFDPLFRRELCTHAVDHAMTDEELFMAFQHMNLICDTIIESKEARKEITLSEDLRRKIRTCDQQTDHPENILGLAGEILSLYRQRQRQRQRFRKSPLANTLMALDEACKLAEQTQSAILLMTLTRNGLVSFVILPNGKTEKICSGINVRIVAERLAQIRKFYQQVFSQKINYENVLEFLKNFEDFLEIFGLYWTEIISLLDKSTQTINIVCDGFLSWIPHHAVTLRHGEDAGARLGLQYYIGQAPTITTLQSMYQKERNFLSKNKQNHVIVQNGLNNTDLVNVDYEVHRITTLDNLVTDLKKAAVHLLLLHGGLDLISPFTESHLSIEKDSNCSISIGRVIDFLTGVEIGGPVVAWICESAGPDPFSLMPDGFDTAMIMARAPAVISSNFLVPTNEQLVGNFFRTLIDELSKGQTTARCLRIAQSELSLKDPWQKLTFLGFLTYGCAVGNV